ncbi:type II toxin-antitoxin system VapC family toxin [candidate division KSB1 bacterium]|nr:type II toxin-antitoxin system VapC family toxin [candidate division KSB1 bacterium]MBL7095962.1 type II toxin-antitoxin system VapC family toxin [candidate division KSB1 bacterium]
MYYMYLLDANILRHFGEGHPTLRLHLEKIPWSNIALPSVVVAEVLQGRSSFALKAPPPKAPLAHSLLLQTFKLLNTFNVALFDEKCSDALIRLRKKHKGHKRYANMMIAAIAITGNHIVVTRNQRHFMKYLLKNQLANWIDEKPK